MLSRNSQYSFEVCENSFSVRSSLLASVGYSIDATLDLELRSGAIYRYFAVPQAVFDGLITAESKGIYFNRNIRNRFRYQRLA